MKKFVKIDATTFLMLSPPPDLPAQKPPMSPWTCMMTQAWHVFHANSMTCHTWT